MLSNPSNSSIHCKSIAASQQDSEFKTLASQTNPNLDESSTTDHCGHALPHKEVFQTLSIGKKKAHCPAVEFYADGCEVCQELAPEVYKIEAAVQVMANDLYCY
ncbi:hypothetical protein SESBI_04166 [Sesbania bispinosa]|nr:hypothetical protein SESBI_04166 [Sesbania bispinosa]